MLSFTIWLTNRCNLKCTYCYERHNFNREKENVIISKKEIILFIVNKVKEMNSREICINFHGGEPLIKYDDMVEYVQLAKYFLKGYSVFYFLTTNGVLLNSDIVKFIEENRIHLTISLDGCKEAHDLNRKYIDGSGSYEDVIYNIDHFRLDKSRLRIRMTVTANNVVYLSKSVSSLVEQGFCCIVPAAAIDDEKWEDMTFKILEEELKKIKRMYKNKKNLMIAMIDKSQMRKKSMCGGGITCFNIMNNGDVYPCEFVTGNENFILGNIKNLHVDLSKLENLYRLDGYMECQDCNYRYYCEGMRCKYINVINTGNYQMPPNNLCEIENIKYRVFQDF